MSQRVVFTIDAAERIASAVRKVEAGNRNESPLSFRKVDLSRMPKSVRMATFSGPWLIDEVNTVQLRNDQSERGTLLATNLLIDLTDNVEKNCVIGKDGSAWYLINWQWSTALAMTAAEVTIDGIVFGRRPAGFVSEDASPFTLPVITCGTASIT